MFAIPAGNLGSAALALARQANVSVGVTDSAIARLPAPAVRGRMSVADAFKRLLRDLPARAEPIDATSWRVVAAPARRSAAPAVRTPAIPSSSPEAELIVTGSKTGTSYRHYAGTAQIVFGSELGAADAAKGSEALTGRLPTLSQTHLGSGRNKLFIRGIADSSFNGPSQATVGEYFGDVRLNYNAPDPDISLYDVETVEVLEGPQGTLYGAGALGGVIRIVPAHVDLIDDSADFALGRSSTRHGADSRDAVAVANLVLDPARVGARIVAFDTIEGGYIDDPSRGLTNINRTHKKGGRVAFRYMPGPWRIEAGAIVQNISTADGQYSDRGALPLQRSSRVSQPFDNDYLMGHVSIARDWGSLSFVSASGLVRQSLNSRYDFTAAGAPAPTIFDQGNRIDLITNETRLSRHDRDGVGWVLGTAILYDRERLTRSLGAPSDPPRILGLSNSVTEGALFGEAGLRLLPDVIGSAGVRLQYTHLVGRALDRDVDVGEPRRDEYAFVPSLSVAWRPGAGLEVFARYQEGSRPGGLSIVPGLSTPTVDRFQGDSLSSLEAGGRFESGKIALGVSVSHARWEDIQADLVDMAGLPFTANIGSGRIWGAEGHVTWRPLEALRLSAAIFGNDSLLTSPSAAFAGSGDAELPNVAHVGIRTGVEFSKDLADGWRLEAGATARYVGHSRLGIGSLDVVQGNYTIASLSGRIAKGSWGLSFDLDNLLDNRGNTFALGNPFGVAAGNQIVPPRPRTLRIGVDAHF